MAEQQQPERSREAAVADPGQSPPVWFAGRPGADWCGQEQRRLERFAVQGTRPIALRPLVDGDAAQAPWILADILDISLGGLCLLLGGPVRLEEQQQLLLDLRSHPDFGVLRLEAEARWWVISDAFATLGLRLAVPLAQIPRLELERRLQRRDPNLEVWAHS